MGFARWLRRVGSLGWLIWMVCWFSMQAEAKTYKLSFVPEGGKTEISQEAHLSNVEMLWEEDSREIYRWFAEKAEEQGRGFPFAAKLKDCAEGKKEKCPAQTPWVKLTLLYGGQEVRAHWPIQSKQKFFFEAIFKQHPRSWELAGVLLKWVRMYPRSAFRLLQALESYADALGEKKSLDFASLAASQFVIHRTVADAGVKFYYLLEEHLPKLRQERGGKASTFVSALWDEVYVKSRFDVMAYLKGNRVGRGFSDLLRLLTAVADVCDRKRGTTFSSCHGSSTLLHLRRWVLRSAYRAAYEERNEGLRKKWLAHAGHIFDRSGGIDDRGQSFTLDQLLDESDPKQRSDEALRGEGVNDVAAYRRMVLEVIGRLKITDPYQRRRAYRRLLPLAGLSFLRTEVGLALRGIFDLGEVKQRKEVFEILWEEGQRGRRSEGFVSWSDTFFANPQAGWVEAYNVHLKLSSEIHREYRALRRASIEDIKKDDKAWRILLAAAAARLEQGDDLRDPSVLSWKKQAVLLQAALKHSYRESCILQKPSCKGAQFLLAGRLIRHLTSWRRVPSDDGVARKTEIRRQFSNLTPLFKSLSFVDEPLLRQNVWLLVRVLPRWSLYRSAIPLAEREREWLSEVVKGFDDAKVLLAQGLKEPQHRVWDRLQSLFELSGVMGLIEGCQGDKLTASLVSYNNRLQGEFQKLQEQRRAFFPKREGLLSALARMFGDKARHCKMDGSLETKLASLQALLEQAENKERAAEELSKLHLNRALGGIGQAQAPASNEALKTLFGVDKITDAYAKEKEWIVLWGRLSLQKDLPCGELVDRLKQGEAAKWKVFEVLREVLWLQAQGLCIHRRRLFSTILPRSERTGSLGLFSQEEMSAAKAAILRMIGNAGVSRGWVQDFETLAGQALEGQRDVKNFSRRWGGLQSRLFRLLKEKEAEWPTEDARFSLQGAVLASSYLSHLHSTVRLEQRQKEADRLGLLAVPSVHPLRYLNDSKAEEDIKNLKGLVAQRNQQIRYDLQEVADNKDAFFRKRADERQRIYNALQRAYLELGEMRLEARKLGLESEIFAIRHQVVQSLKSVADLHINVAKKHEALAVLKKERSRLEVELRGEGVDLATLEIKIKALEERLIESEIQGRDTEAEIVKEQEKLAKKSIRLNQRRLKLIDKKIKAIQDRNKLIEQKLAAFGGVFSALDQKQALLQEQIKKQGETEQLVREKAVLLAQKKRKIQEQFVLLEEKSGHLHRKLGVLHEQKKKILEKNQKVAKLWQTRIKETELALATLQTEITARKAAIKISIDLSADIIKKTEENIKKVQAARAAHAAQMAAQRRKSFWSRVASIGFRIVGAVVGTICCGNPMLGVQIGGLVGDFIAKGAIQGDWGGAWRGLGVGAATMLLTQGIGDLGGVGTQLASGISNVAIRAGVEQLANVAVSSLVQNAMKGLETGQFGDVLENTLKDVVQDLPGVAFQVVTKLDLGPNLGKAMEVFKIAHEHVLAGDLNNIKKLGDPAFLQSRALAVGEHFAKKALKTHAPGLMKAVQKFEDLQSKYNLFPKVEDVLKDGFTAVERHLKQRVQELPQELFQKHLQPEIEGFLRRHTPKAIKDIEVLLRDKLGIAPKDLVDAIKNQDIDILKKKFEDKLPAIQEAVVGGLKKHFGREIKQLEGLKAKVEGSFARVKSQVEGAEQAFRHRLSRSLDQIQSLGQSAQDDMQRILRNVQPEGLIKKLRKDLTRSLPQISSEHLEGLLQYQAQRYANLATRFHQLRLHDDWRGKEEYLRFVLLGRKKAQKLLAHRIVEARRNAERKAEGFRQRAERLKAQAAFRKIQAKAKAVQGIAQEYAQRFQNHRGLKWGSVVEEIKQKLGRVITDPTELMQETKILEAQLDPAKMTRIVSKKLKPLQQLFKTGGERTSAACQHGFDPCERALDAYKTNVHKRALQFQAQIEAELDGKSKDLHNTQVKKYKQEIGKDIDKLGGEIRVQENQIKKHGTLADVAQIKIDEKKTEERLSAAEVEEKQNEIQANTAAIEKVKSWVSQSEVEIEKKRQTIHKLQTQIQAQEGEIGRMDGDLQKMGGLLALVDSKRAYLGFQRALKNSKWMREVLMFRKQQGIYTSEAVKIRKAQAEKILEQGRLLQQESELRLKEAEALLKKSRLKRRIAKKQIREAEIRLQIGKIRQEQQRLREARLWLRIDALEAALRSVDMGVFSAIRQQMLSAGWALQELQQLQNASLERISLSLAVIFQAFEYSGIPIPDTCKGRYEDRGLEKLPAYLQDCFSALRQKLAFQSLALSCKTLVIEQGKRRSLLPNASEALEQFFSREEGQGVLTFVPEASAFPKTKRLSLMRVDIWVDMVKVGEHQDDLPEQVAAEVSLEQPALGSSQSPESLLDIHLRQVESLAAKTRASGRTCHDSIRAESNDNQKKLMYYNPLMRWRLGLKPTEQERDILKGYRPVRVQINLVYRQPKLQEIR